MHTEEAMRRCLDLAHQGQLLVGNGAMVGAVLVRNETIIAEGWHRGFGLSHAERDLLESFDQPIMPNDVLHVNLEPCCHQGKTPPCTDIILERGIAHVVYGMMDPDARVAGQGIAALQAAGVKVTGPIDEENCRRLNRGFVWMRTKQRPWITLKRAVANDGAISNPDGSPLRITTEAQDIRSHTELRCHHDAILVGVDTIITDDPRLDARLDVRKRNYHPYRIILDPHLRIPVTARVVTDDYRQRTIVVHGPIVNPEMDEAAQVLAQQHVLLREVPLVDGSFDWPMLWAALCEPRESYHGLVSILVEGGQRTWKNFADAGMVDEEVTLVGG